MLLPLLCFALGAAFVWIPLSLHLEHLSSSAMGLGSVDRLAATTTIDATTFDGGGGRNAAAARFVRTGRASPAADNGGSDDDNNLRRRIRLLENKLNSYLSFGSDPFMSSRASVRCRNSTEFDEWMTCLDDFPPSAPKGCVVYDFGIRKNPEFGAILSKEPYRCQVFAFDPSPETRKWYLESQEESVVQLRANPNYHLYTKFGAGYADETITLREYNWQQVSIVHYPDHVVDLENCPPDAKNCNYKSFGTQKKHQLKVRSLESIMRHLNHTHVDVVKIDIEGSEYRFLESMIESGSCKQVDQLLLEWHHYDVDERYGASSWPLLNVFTKLLETECNQIKPFHVYSETGWLNNERKVAEMQLQHRYNLISYMREKTTASATGDGGASTTAAAA